MFFCCLLHFSLSESQSDATNSSILVYEYNENLMSASVKSCSEKIINNLFIPSYVEYEGKNYTVNDIQDDCFNGAEIYGKITFPSTLISIGASSFNGSIKDFIEIVIPDSVEEIKNRAFAHTNIISITFGNKIQKIGDKSFKKCIFLSKEINFPESLITVGKDAFAFDPIIGVKGGINITSFGENCFGRTSVSYFDFPPKLTEISAFLFQYSQLEGLITLPINVKSIGEGSFLSTRITDIVFPEKIEEIGDYAFFKCTNLSIILDFENSIQRIGLYAFSLTGIKGIKNVQCFNISFAAFAYCEELQGTVSLNLLDSDTVNASISPAIFQGCINVKSINIQANIIPEYFADGCSSLESVLINSNLDDDDYTFEEICSNAFSMCGSLRSVRYPNTIKRIGERAFYCCKSYSGTLPLNNFTNLITIGDEAFLGCDSLVGELVFPDSLKNIGKKAFIDCKFAGSIIIPSSVKTIGDYAFFSCSEFSGMLSIGNGCKSIGESVFSHCTGLTGNIQIGSNITYIGPRAFFGCNSLTGNLEIPASVQAIGDSAFTNCNKLTGSLILHDGLMTIGISAFAECTGFTGSLVLPSTIKSIGSMAFFKCIGFEDVYFRNSSTEVGFMAFSRMHNKCFSNVPQHFDHKKYDSDNFAGVMLPESSLNMHCSAFKAIDGLLVSITSICCSGGFIFVVQFAWTWLSSRLTNIKKLNITTKEIIADARKDESGDEKEIARKIINKIHDRLVRETEYDKFNTTKFEAKRAVDEAIDEEWATVLPAIKENIMDRALDGIEFYKPCACCSKYRRKNTDDTSCIIEATLI